MNREEIEQRLKRNAIPHHADLAEKLDIYLRLLQEWNARMDLTATLEEDEMADSASCDRAPSMSVSDASTRRVRSACSAIGRAIRKTFP